MNEWRRKNVAIIAQPQCSDRSLSFYWEGAPFVAGVAVVVVAAVGLDVCLCVFRGWLKRRLDLMSSFFAA